MIYPGAFPAEDAHGRQRTPYAIHCTEGPLEGYPGCGLVYLTRYEYNLQMAHPDYTWRCPICRMYPCVWDDYNYEEMTEADGMDER